MTILMLSTILVIQGGGAQATPRPTTTSQNPTSNNRDVQDAARELREAIRSNIDQEIIAAKAQAVARAAQNQARAAAAQAGQAPPPIPAPPFPPSREITIQGANGERTVIGVPSGLARDVIPPQAVDITVAFFLMIAVIVIGLPLARAFARRMDRRGTPAEIPNEISAQLNHLNQAVDAIALEVERISEGQRYTTRLLSEQRDPARQTLPSGVDR